MNRETELHTGTIPEIHQQRSRFDESHSLVTSFNAGEIIPIYTDLDILPGSTITMDISQVIRETTLIHPIYDNAMIDIMAFFVPDRLTWEHHAEFWGESDDPWTQPTTYTQPMVTAPSGGWAGGTIADYMGVPTYVGNLEVRASGFRSYAKIFTDWFRDENLQYSAHMYDDDTTRTGSNGTNYITDIELGGMPAKAAKIHDRFTSALPSPQKGPDVSIPLGTSANVFTAGTNHAVKPYPMTWAKVDGTVPSGLRDLHLGAGSWPDTIAENGYTPGANAENVVPNNLYADLANATAATINQLRTAFAIQKYYEMAARGGSRYIEYLRNVFGVVSSDARLQRSEYLGGIRCPINVDQVIQTSSTDSVSPQGNTAGMSVTVGLDSLFTKSFEEHGCLMVLAVVRYPHTYQQGLHKMFKRKSWEEFYNPFFANLGEQAIELDEIYATGTSADKTAFGYQEAWAEYRMKENRVSGMMRSNWPGGSLDSWHYADDYAVAPTLSSAWIMEDENNIDRTLAVSHTVAHQFTGNFYFDLKYTLPMPVYSIPGLIDHV